MEHINLEIVKAQRVITPEGEAIVKGMVKKHAELTGSPKAKQVLANWEENLPRFWQLVPPGKKKYSYSRICFALCVCFVRASSVLLFHVEERF